MKIAVYGTLRKGMRNFESFKRGAEKFEILKEGVKLKDHTLITEGLPFVAPKEGEDVVVDILEVDRRTGVRITAMEINAGYYADVVMIDDIPCMYYPFPLTKQQLEQENIEDYVKYNAR